MTFTDDDLKRLKENLYDVDDADSDLTLGEVRALLARLEAAEACIYACPDHFCETEVHKVWRKAAGRTK